ncbi:hypothetical protein BH753_gp084 [Bacillus phage Shbh1]|uniref:Uncharacterized protein n=1 Tax=Bacillus phage Shbh1 TaxID=1796992 RepID=A0A142F1A9_9CAUD|nr:hypothetical protein BH753_gp084 [Bacillus phage Shbh1]AMQ66566.1 hypothetical protein [Bacillus phage Shbh1]
MSFIFNVYVNWTFGANLPVMEPYEWKLDDDWELVDKMPVIKVTPDFYDFVELGYSELPKEFLDLTVNTTAEVYKIEDEDSEVKKLHGVAAITDGSRVLAICTENHKEPLLKSRLFYQRDLVVLDSVKHVPALKLKYEYKPQKVSKDLCDKIMDVQGEYMVGLTRKERTLKSIVFGCLFSLAYSGTEEEVKYWYTDLFPEIPNKPVDKLVEDMYDFIKIGWSPKHESFGDSIVNVYDGEKDLWVEVREEEQIK